MSHVDFGLPEYHQSKAKFLGNLHERMHLVKEKKEILRTLIEDSGDFPAESLVHQAMHELGVAIMDLETEVSLYKSDKKPRA